MNLTYSNVVLDKVGCSLIQVHW